jgi:hypothetical protein
MLFGLTSANLPSIMMYLHRDRVERKWKPRPRRVEREPVERRTTTGTSDDRQQQDNAPAPAAQPAYKVVKREKDRWWEVRDLQDELRDGVQARRGGGGAPARRVTEGSSRGEVRRGCCDLCTPLAFAVSGPGRPALQFGPGGPADGLPRPSSGRPQSHRGGCSGRAEPILFR